APSLASGRGSGWRRRVVAASPDFDRVILDDRVGEELLAHLLDPGPGGGRVGLGDLQFDQLALPDFADIGKAEPLQGIADRLPLLVEGARFGADKKAALRSFGRRHTL